MTTTTELIKTILLELQRSNLEAYVRVLEICAPHDAYAEAMLAIIRGRTDEVPR